MGQHARLPSARGKPFDWLRDLDKRASRFPRAQHISEYPLFLFARYPRLRPGLIRRKRLDEGLYEAGYELSAQLFWQCEKQVEKHAERALRNLTPDQRIQLAALLIDVQSEIENFNSRRRARDWAGTLGREGRALQRMLPRNLDAARRSLRLLAARGHRYAALDPSVGFKYRGAANAASDDLRELPEPKHRSFDEFPALSRELRQITRSPVTSAMVRLYWFFRSECGLRSGEAEVRVALLRNSLWKNLDVEEVALVLDNETDPSKGCRAVYLAVARFRTSKSTSR